MKIIFNGVVSVKSIHKIALGVLVSTLSINSASAEPYVGLSLGWTFSQKMTGLKGSENLNYPDPSGGVGDPTSGQLLFPDTKYTDVKLKDVLQGGLKAGYYFESSPNFGVELEVNYSQPNLLRQNVTLSNQNFKNVYYPDGIGGSFQAYPDGHLTEDQLKAKVQLLQFNLNGLYRYQGFDKFTPYIGGGPSLNVIRITGTGYSGIIVDPFQNDSSCPVGSTGAICSNVNTTSVNLGVNFKLGAEYKFDEQWGLAGEYHYNWVPVDISSFRSVSNLKADLETHSLSAVLVRHF